MSAAPSSANELGGVAGWVTDVIDRLGAPGVGALITLENVFPPLPSELVLAFAGFSVGQGRLYGPTAWVAATAGSLLGAYVLYAVGALVGPERLETLAGKRWFVLCSQKDLRRGELLFERHSGKVVLFARLVPLLRSVVSIPAGVIRMPLWRFTLLTVIGSGVWNAAFLVAGYQLGSRWEQVAHVVEPVGYAVLAVLALVAVVLAVRKLSVVKERRSRR